MDILFATGNLHKKEELDRILAPHRMILPSDLGINFYAEETGSTYLENALIKAQVLRRASLEAGKDLPVLADDSGLSVPALGGAPGVYSARYGSDEAGRDLTSEERNALLLKNMAHLPEKDRGAFFVCCMVLMMDDYRVFTAQETFGGVIASSPAGVGGFGYDPVFYLPSRGCSVAELADGEKDEISHRGLAGKQMMSLLSGL